MEAYIWRSQAPRSGTTCGPDFGRRKTNEYKAGRLEKKQDLPRIGVEHVRTGGREDAFSGVPI